MRRFRRATISRAPKARRVRNVLIPMVKCMKKLLLIDCCIRGEVSRTRRLAASFLSALPAEYTVERLDLGELPILPLDRKRYFAREALLDRGKLCDPLFDLAKQFAAADAVLLATPFWDMGIPAQLKTYFENVSIAGIAFSCNETGEFTGLCRAARMILLTTRGMDIPDGSEMEQASPYLKALCTFFGIGGFEMVSAWGMDVEPPAEAEKRLSAAAASAAELAKSL